MALFPLRKRNKPAGSDNSDDRELILMYQKTGDFTFLNILFEKYIHLIYGICLKFLRNDDMAKDAVMDILEKMIHDLSRFEVKEFKSWLYQVSKNHCLMALRSKKKEHSFLIKELDEDKATNDYEEINFEEEVGFKRDEILEAMKLLNGKQKTCLELKYFESKSYKEICEITGFDEKQVKTYIQNGKRNLKNILLRSHE